MDPAVRKKLLDQLQQRLYDVSASVPVVTYYYQHFTSCRLQNWKPINPTYNTSTVVAAWLDDSGSCRGPVREWYSTDHLASAAVSSLPLTEGGRPTSRPS